MATTSATDSVAAAAEPKSDDVPSDNVRPGSAKAKLDRVWKKLLQDKEKNKEASEGEQPMQRDWPGMDALFNHIRTADYNQVLTCPFDLSSLKDNNASSTCSSEPKMLCPHGVVCQASLELFPLPTSNNGDVKPYTGVLAPGSKWPSCILRLSSAMKPPVGESKESKKSVLGALVGEKLRTTQLFPCSALKIFLDDNESDATTTITSRNLLFMGSKLGQRERDFFAHCQCTSMTEQMPFALRPLLRYFVKYSKYPLSLGLSHACSPTTANQAAEGEENNNFPFALIFKPCIATNKGRSATAGGNDRTSFDWFMDYSLNQIAPETHLYDVFACPSPHVVAESRKVQRIGRVVTKSAFYLSGPGDGLVFRHQIKDEDYAQRPDWPEALKEPIVIDYGKTKGTVGSLTGWKVFEQHIEKGDFIDFETAAAAS